MLHNPEVLVATAHERQAGHHLGAHGFDASMQEVGVPLDNSQDPGREHLRLPALEMDCWANLQARTALRPEAATAEARLEGWPKSWQEQAPSSSSTTMARPSRQEQKT